MSSVINGKNVSHSGLLVPLIRRFWLVVNPWRYAVSSTIVFGLLAHLFFFSHKLVTFDDSLFSYGQKVSSGRWGLALLTELVPPFSMP